MRDNFREEKCRDSESTSSRARAFELCLKNRSIASLCKDCDDSIVSGRSSAFLGVLFSIRSHSTV